MIYMKMWTCKVCFNILDVQIDEYENIDTFPQFHVMTIVAYVEVGESIISKVHLLVN